MLFNLWKTVLRDFRKRHPLINILYFSIILQFWKNDANFDLFLNKQKKHFSRNNIYTFSTCQRNNSMFNYPFTYSMPTKSTPNYNLKKIFLQQYTFFTHFTYFCEIFVCINEKDNLWRHIFFPLHCATQTEVKKRKKRMKNVTFMRRSVWK